MYEKYKEFNTKDFFNGLYEEINKRLKSYCDLSFLSILQIFESQNHFKIKEIKKYLGILI